MTTLRRLLLTLASVCCVATSAARAQDAVVAWQITQFDVTATLPAPGAERTLAARATLTARNVGNTSGTTFTARLNRAVVVKSATVNDRRWTRRPRTSSGVLVDVPHDIAIEPPA